MAGNVPHLERIIPEPVVQTVQPTIVNFMRKTLFILLFDLFVGIPCLNLFGVIEPHNLSRLGRYLCYAIAALGIDLIWGYSGVLSLCHALFFCLGGYAVAMHLSLPAA